MELFNISDSDDSDDSQKFHDLSTRLENIDLNNEEEIWNKLNAEERREFKKLISSGNIRNLLPEWQPWWEFYKSKKLISEVGSEVGNSDDEFVCPDIALEVPAFSELTVCEIILSIEV